MMYIKVFRPRHSSALGNPPEPTASKRRRENYKIESTLRTHESHVVQIFVHKEKAMWNIFAPIFNLNNDISLSFLEVIIYELQSRSLLTCHQLQTGKCQIYYDEIDSDKANTDIETEEENKSMWDESTFYLRRNSKKRNRRHILVNETSNHAKSLLIYILPPMPIESLYYYPDMRPERIFTSNLVKLENLQIKLQSLNAYIATLGGGYFLCHFLSTAVCLARYQRRIALQLNDFNLAMKCTINEAYNYIHAGMIQKALSLIQKTEEEATIRKSYRLQCSMNNDCGEEDVILSMCNAAKWFASCVQSINGENQFLLQSSKRSVTNDLIGNRNQEVSATHDDFQRIRIFQVKNVAQGKKII